MGLIVYDTFTNTTGTGLASHTGETGATWTEHASFTSGSAQIQNNRAASGSTNISLFYPSGVPANADYWSSAIMNVSTNSGVIALCARIDTGSPERYEAGYYQSNGYWALRRISSGGSITTLVSSSATLSTSTDYLMYFLIHNAKLFLYVDGALLLSHEDSSPITAAGRPGLRWQNPSADATAGYRFADYTVHDYEFPAGYLDPLPTVLRM